MLRMEVPGIGPKDIEVSPRKNLLTFRGEKKWWKRRRRTNITIASSAGTARSRAASAAGRRRSGKGERQIASAASWWCGSRRGEGRDGSGDGLACALMQRAMPL